MVLNCNTSFWHISGQAKNTISLKSALCDHFETIRFWSFNSFKTTICVFGSIKSYYKTKLVEFYNFKTDYLDHIKWDSLLFNDEKAFLIVKISSSKPFQWIVVPSVVLKKFSSNYKIIYCSIIFCDISRLRNKMNVKLFLIVSCFYSKICYNAQN